MAAQYNVTLLTTCAQYSYSHVDTLECARLQSAVHNLLPQHQ